MPGEPLDNVRIAHLSALLPPSIAFQETPGDMSTYHQVVDARQQINNIMTGTDDRLLVVIGVGSESEPAALLELAGQLNSLKPSVQRELLLVVQADAALVSEGPECVQINRGLRQARELLLQINRLGLPTACEFGDTITPQFFADLLSWASVSAGIETLRELVSGLSMPVGLRADADDASTALQAIDTTGTAHWFLGVSGEGVCGIVRSSGNPDVAAQLRAATRHAASAAKASACVEAASAHGETPVVLDCCALEKAAQLSELTGALAASVGKGSRAVRGVSATLPAEGWGGVAPLLSALAKAVVARRAAKSPLPAAAAASGDDTNNLRIGGVRPLLPPACLLEELPREASHAAVVARGREELATVLGSAGGRLVMLVGPPSVDDTAACLEFASRLATLAAEVKEDVLLMARAPFVSLAACGWTSLVKDPARDGSCAINRGLRQARQLLLQINQLGLPTACEFGDTITPQFVADLLSYAVVSSGGREERSETLRELVSGLSMPAGLRLPTDADGADEVDGGAASLAFIAEPQVFFGVTSHGIAGIVQSKGNADVALLMRGGGGTPAQRAGRVAAACGSLTSAAVVVECGGAGVAPDEQAKLVAQLADAIGRGELSQLRGLSLSSHLLSGSQSADVAPSQRVHGLSCTEPCLDWAATTQAVHAVAAAVRKRNTVNGGAAKKPRRG